MKYTLGPVRSLPSGGEYIELNYERHTAYGQLVWTLEGDAETPELQKRAADLVSILNAAETAKKNMTELERLRRLHKFLWSYNPGQPMGDGMAAQFKDLMRDIERAQNAD